MPTNKVVWSFVSSCTRYQRIVWGEVKTTSLMLASVPILCPSVSKHVGLTPYTHDSFMTYLTSYFICLNIATYAILFHLKVSLIARFESISLPVWCQYRLFLASTSHYLFGCSSQCYQKSHQTEKCGMKFLQLLVFMSKTSLTIFSWYNIRGSQKVMPPLHFKSSAGAIYSKMQLPPLNFKIVTPQCSF